MALVGCLIVCDDKRRFRRHLFFRVVANREPWNALQIFTFRSALPLLPSVCRSSVQPGPLCAACHSSLVTSGGVSGRRQHSHCYSHWIARVSAPDLLRQIVPPQPSSIPSKSELVALQSISTRTTLTPSLLLRLLLLLAANARLVFLSLPLLRVTALSPLRPAARLPFRRLTTCLPSTSCAVRLTRKIDANDAPAAYHARFR